MVRRNTLTTGIAINSDAKISSDVFVISIPKTKLHQIESCVSNVPSLPKKKYSIVNTKTVCANVPTIATMMSVSALFIEVLLKVFTNMAKVKPNNKRGNTETTGLAKSKSSGVTPRVIATNIVLKPKASEAIIALLSPSSKAAIITGTCRIVIDIGPTVISPNQDRKSVV